MLVCINKAWGVICSESLSSQTAKVICKQLGYSTHSKTVMRLTVYIYTWFRFLFKLGSTLYKTELDSSSNVALLTRIYCKGSEDSIKECDIASHYTRASTCGIHDIIGVECQSNELILVNYSTIIVILLGIFSHCV